MKKHFLFAFLLFLALPSMAQVAAVKPQQHGGHNGSSTLTIVAPRGLSFWLFVDDVLQNEDPVHSLCVRNLWNDNFYIRVELDNQDHNCVGQFINLRQSKTISIVQSNKLIGLEQAQINIRPELTLDLITQQPITAGNGQNPIMPVPPMPMGMNPHDYESACQIIAKESFDSSKLTVAKQVVSGNPMTASQILGICKMFSFESNKLEFAKYAYPYCTEPNKYFLLNDAFSYESSKRELDEYVRKY
jgi:hypothetical protein